MKVMNLQNYRWWMDQYPTWWAINLLEDDCQEIEAEARRRVEKGKLEAARNGWENRVDEHKHYQANVSGVAGEFAAGLVYNFPFKKTRMDSTIEDFHSGDLSDRIEVKSRMSAWTTDWDLLANNTPRNPIRTNRFYVNTLTCLYPKWLFVIGYMHGNKLKTEGYNKKHFTKHHEMKGFDFRCLEKPVSLFDEIRKHGVNIAPR